MTNITTSTSTSTSSIGGGGDDASQHLFSYSSSSSGGNSDSLALVLKATTEADLSVVLLVLLGSFFAFKGVFDSKGVSDMGKLVYHVSLPCLLFSKILYEFSLERLHLLWVLPMACFLHVLTGYLVGQGLGKIMCVNKQERRVGTASTMFGNVGALAIAVVDSLCHSETLAALSGGQAQCTSIGISYIAFYLITQNILMFTWGEALMVHSQDEEEEEENSLETTEITETEGGGLLGRRSMDGNPFEDGKKDYLCRVSPMPVDVTHQGSRGRGGYRGIGGGGGARLRLSHSAPKYSVRLGQNGLKKVQSHLALEADHCGEAPLGGSPTKKLTNAINQYIHYMGSSKDDLQHEAASGYYHHHHHGAEGVPFLQGENVGGGGGGGGEESSPMKRAQEYVYGKAVDIKKSVKSTWTAFIDKTIVVLIRLVKTPALQAAFSAIFLASFPKIKGLLVMEPGSAGQPPLYFVYDAVSTMGKAQVPVSMIMLSGTATIRYMTSLRNKAIKAAEEDGSVRSLDLEGNGVDQGQGEKGHFSLGATLVILLGRPVIMPFVGLGWWWLMNYLQLIPDIEGHTPILQLIMLIESAVPTAQNVVMLLLVHGRMEQGEALAQIVLLQMAISIVTFTVCCSFFQYLVIPA